MPLLIPAHARLGQLALATLITTLLAACGGGDSTQANPPTPAPTDAMATFTQQKLDWKACDPSLMEENEKGENAITQYGDRVKCTLMRAPLDYAKPALGELQVALLKFSAGQADRRLGALVINPGGPGGDGLSFGARFGELFTLGDPGDSKGALFKEMANRYDMVGFSPRGTGSSSSLNCSSGERLALANSLTFDRSPENIQNAQYNARLKAEACVKNPLSKYIHTDATARDMDLMRSLLGDAKLNFFGISYGSWIGAWYASLFPERVGRMVLDSSMNIAGSYDDATLLQEMGHQRVIDDIILPYAARHAQRFNLNSDPKQIKQGILALPLKLKTTLVSDYLNVNNATDFDNSLLSITAAFGLINISRQMPQADLPTFHAAIDEYVFASGADNKETTTLAHLMLDATFKPRTREKVVIGSYEAVYASVICNDLGTVGDEQHWVDVGNEYVARYPLTGGLATANPCLYWSKPVVTRPPLAAAATASPVLMLQSRYDAQTPIEGAQKTLDALPSASMIVVENEFKHGLFPYDENCVDNKVADYYLSGAMPPRTSSCAGKLLPADALATSAQQRGASVKTSPFTDPAAAAEVMRRIHQLTSDMNRKRSF